MRGHIRWLLSAPLVVNLFILLYGASFTLTITLWQAFSTAGYEEVKVGMHALGEEFANPAAWQKIAAGLYAGGFAALTVLRNEVAAAVAIGVDMGKRVASLLDSWCFALAHADEAGVATLVSTEEFDSMSQATDNIPSSPLSTKADRKMSWLRRWAANLLLGVCVGLFVLLACIFVHSTRVASLCVLAAQSLVKDLALLLGEAHAARFGVGGRGRAVAVGALSALGMLIQSRLYLASAGAWYLPNGAAIPARLHSILYAPLALENALEEVRLACKCDFGRLHLQGFEVGAKVAHAVAGAAAEVASA
uniref:Uncharacterized protein n=1 Tax=Coccolithus braarudii TaxID=221442 RepID=A0A7S0LGW1_9EUKA|mmetsp:Transcript_39833/g.84926  ORF Transcript_39833/g.84926 Transcript_39833/m.84926 type:complete len:306 (+) Transcript_39833:57-974(+)|eukprot:CAMPEP_0183336820 /NCGR_PEP_ID=MMETSP0164_2-20130417/4683_1 /TAXON_ID=221442 /ORGANISM="Coccolithus pelagicus ssp braarudi, Strain PLY182g" /LENGTH=305 /DNA_ID=CAMNT_0025506419 /DNA_START=55 /DNA_END=972 /DNA_ORIENTATION=-